METSSEGPSLAPQWLRGASGGAAAAGRRIVKASPADPGSAPGPQRAGVP